MNKMRYRLTSDDDGHWFVIPADKKLEWNQYVENIAKASDWKFEGTFPEKPEWAEQIDQPYRLTFENWRQE